MSPEERYRTKVDPKSPTNAGCAFWLVLYVAACIGVVVCIRILFPHADEGEEWPIIVAFWLLIGIFFFFICYHLQAYKPGPALTYRFSMGAEDVQFQGRELVRTKETGYGHEAFWTRYELYKSLSGKYHLITVENPGGPYRTSCEIFESAKDLVDSEWRHKKLLFEAAKCDPELDALTGMIHAKHQEAKKRQRKNSKVTYIP